MKLASLKRKAVVATITDQIANGNIALRDIVIRDYVDAMPENALDEALERIEAMACDG